MPDTPCPAGVADGLLEAWLAFRAAACLAADDGGGSDAAQQLYKDMAAAAASALRGAATIGVRMMAAAAAQAFKAGRPQGGDGGVTGQSRIAENGEVGLVDRKGAADSKELLAADVAAMAAAVDELRRWQDRCFVDSRTTRRRRERGGRDAGHSPLYPLTPHPQLPFSGAGALIFACCCRSRCLTL